MKIRVQVDRWVSNQLRRYQTSNKSAPKRNMKRQAPLYDFIETTRSSSKGSQPNLHLAIVCRPLFQHFQLEY